MCGKEKEQLTSEFPVVYFQLLQLQSLSYCQASSWLLQEQYHLVQQ